MENHYFITSTAYSISERKTKKGIVYDVIFRAYKDINGAPIQKKLCGYETRRLAPLAHTTIRRKFSEFASAAGVKQIRIHDLRHSYVSLLIHTGANYTVIAELIGDNKEQVVKTYGHMYPNDKAAAVSLID